MTDRSSWARLVSGHECLPCHCPPAPADRSTHHVTANHRHICYQRDGFFEEMNGLCIVSLRRYFMMFRIMFCICTFDN